MSEDLKSKVIDTIDGLIPKGRNILGLREADMMYGIIKAKEAVEKLFTEISTQDCISRQAVIEAMWELRRDQQMLDDTQTADKVMRGIFLAEQRIKNLPSVDVPDRRVGKWLEREVIHAKEAKAIITEWQSCKCSVCGCYDTRPYLYCFNKPSFCSWCGADMRGEADG